MKLRFPYGKRKPVTTLGSIFQRRRLELGLYLDDVAKRAGVSKRTFIRWLKNTRNIRKSNILAVCSALELDPDSVLSHHYIPFKSKTPCKP